MEEDNGGCSYHEGGNGFDWFLMGVHMMMGAVIVRLFDYVFLLIDLSQAL